MTMLTFLSRNLFYPLWDIRDRSTKLRHLRELERSQWLSREILLERQWASLRKALLYAHEHSPFYRKRFEQAGLRPSDVRTPADLRRLPLTTKQDIRDNLRDIIGDEFNKESLIRAKTGGSTGVSLELFFDKRCEEMRNAAALRSDRWAGWELGQVRAALWGNPPKPVTLKQKLRRALLDRMEFLDTMALNDRSMGEFVALWRRKHPEAVFGHAHSIYIFAKYLRDNGVSDLRPRAIVATSMMLLDHERQLIEQIFQCRVTNRYGCEEVGLIACECEQHDGMHLNIEHLYIEFIGDDGEPVAPGEPGKIVLTDFLNRGMPLLRYRVEDVGVSSDRACKCGRGLPLMERVEGRVADFLKLRDGTQVAGISLIERTLTKVPGIEQLQLVQEAIDRLTINRVRGAGHTTTSDHTLMAELREVFGSEMQIVINDVQRIPQERTGKYRFAICRI